MAKRKELLNVEYVVDTETGIEYVGETDFGISGNLETYLESYGLKGRDEIIGTLSYLIHHVHKVYNEMEEKVRQKPDSNI